MPAQIDLAASAAKVQSRLRFSDEHTIVAARELAAVRASFGRRGAAPWKEWTSTLGLGPTRIRELVRIGAAPDPRAALNEQRARNAARQARHRERSAAARRRKLCGTQAPASVTLPARSVHPEAR